MQKQNTKINMVILEGTGAVLGGGVSALGASKLANYAKEQKEQKNKEYVQNTNIYGQQLHGQPGQPG